jgi:hypothetical protein
MSEAWLSVGAMQPVLPLAKTLPWHIAVSWGLCMAALLWGAARVWHWSALRWIAVVVLVAACLPWALGSPLHWTAYAALAFQTPSNVTCLWCLAWACWGSAQNSAAHAEAMSPNTPESGHRTSNVWRQLPWLSLAGVVLGWALWLDTFNRWPSMPEGMWGDAWNVPFYAWGFGWPALVVVAVSLWAYAAWTVRVTGQLSRGVQVAAVALSMFALTRWPTGNVWDALLDPWLWAACHVQGFKGCASVWRAWRTNKYSRQNSTFSGV